jgi:hypothetical protein
MTSQVLLAVDRAKTGRAFDAMNHESDTPSYLSANRSPHNPHQEGKFNRIISSKHNTGCFRGAKQKCEACKRLRHIMQLVQVPDSALAAAQRRPAEKSIGSSPAELPKLPITSITDSDKTATHASLPSMLAKATRAHHRSFDPRHTSTP